MAKLSTKGLAIIALILSLILVLLIYKYLSGVSEQANKPTTAVIVAKVDIPARTPITAEMLQQIVVPTEFVQPGAMTELKKVVGVMTKEKIVTGEQVTERRLNLPGQSTGFTGLIPPDKVAMSVAVNDVIGVSGFVKPGDYVDVISTFDKEDVGSHTSKTVLQNILVLAVDSDTENGTIETKAGDDKKNSSETKKGSTVTLAVTINEAAQIALAEEKGKFRLALRPFMPSVGKAASISTTPQAQVGFSAGISNKANGEDSSSSKHESAPEQTPAYTPPYSPPPSVSNDTGWHVQTIRGTEVENVPVN